MGYQYSLFSIQSGGCILLSQFVLEQLKVVLSSGRYRESSTQGSPDNKTALGIGKSVIITDCHIIPWVSIKWRSIWGLQNCHTKRLSYFLCHIIRQILRYKLYVPIFGLLLAFYPFFSLLYGLPIFSKTFIHSFIPSFIHYRESWVWFNLN